MCLKCTITEGTMYPTHRNVLKSQDVGVIYVTLKSWILTIPLENLDIALESVLHDPGRWFPPSLYHHGYQKYFIV